MVETVAAVMLIGLLMIAIGKVTLLRGKNQESLNMQYDLLAVDGFMADLYFSYNNCISATVSEGVNGSVVLTVLDKEFNAKVYSYDAKSKACSINGAVQFHADKVVISQGGGQLHLEIKLPRERVLYFNVNV